MGLELVAVVVLWVVVVGGGRLVAWSPPAGSPVAPAESLSPLGRVSWRHFALSFLDSVSELPDMIRDSASTV